jgi:Holliday junction resolvase RusA-like endonuclease
LQRAGTSREISLNMTEIIISGLRPASKKNHRRNFGHISLPSLAYEKFHSLVAEYLLPFSYLHLTKPLWMQVTYEIKGNYHQDIDNALSSVCDCLTDYGIIEDDDLIVNVKMTKKNGFKDWRIVIQLEEIIQ